MEPDAKDELRKHLQDSWSYLAAEMGALVDARGLTIQFKLGPHQRAWRYWRLSNRHWYCYTPHADTKGRFWTWEYKPVGPGAKSRSPKQVRIVPGSLKQHATAVLARNYAGHKNAEDQERLAARRQRQDQATLVTGL